MITFDSIAVYYYGVPVFQLRGYTLEVREIAILDNKEYLRVYFGSRGTDIQTNMDLQMDQMNFYKNRPMRI